MPLVGVVCGHDGTYQSFDTCIEAHRTSDPNRWCHCPTEVLSSASNNAFKRSLAGVSASTILACARAKAMEEVYDYYETPISMYNKVRGTWVHSAMEEMADDADGILRERRIIRYILLPNGKKMRVSGQFDQYNIARRLLIDYKSKDKLPKQPDPRHEAQFNIYAWLLADGLMITDNHGNKLDKPEKVCYTVERIGCQYMTFATKPEGAWLKMKYDVWPLDQTEDMIRTRATVLQEWVDTRVLPQCNDLFPSRYWKCDCEKLTEQLAERGIQVKENHATT